MYIGCQLPALLLKKQLERIVELETQIKTGGVEPKMRSSMCEFCGHVIIYDANKPKPAEVVAEMQAHTVTCKKNPLVAKIAELEGQVVDVHSEYQDAAAKMHEAMSQLEHLQRKVAHGCTDAGCPECDHITDAGKMVCEKD